MVPVQVRFSAAAGLGTSALLEADALGEDDGDALLLAAVVALAVLVGVGKATP
jgi:hypothetical protein